VNRGAPTGVRVAIRIRPLVAREAGQRQGVRSGNGKVTVLGLDRQERCFMVDHVLDSRLPERSTGSQFVRSMEESCYRDGSQEAVYQALGAELVRKAAEGYNTCMLAYGHTGSGKTYTMMGSEFTTDVTDELSFGGATSTASEALRAPKGAGTPRTPVREKEKVSVQTPLERGPLDDAFNMEVTAGSGLIPRTLEAIFATLREEPDTVCIASFYELHNERVRDLLAPMLPKEAPAWQDGGSGGQPRQNVRPQSKTTVHFHPRFGAFVAGVEEVPCEDVDEVLRLVSFGSQVRTTAATMLNECSSRSHAIFSLRLERSQSSNSIMLVDLAGREQERLSMCRTERFKELTLINRSLFHLARCVRELAASQVEKTGMGGKEGSQWHHFRNSKLTMVLGHALAGNSHTAVVGTISPAQSAFEDSLATLRFCESVKQVRTKPALPVSQREAVVIELQDEVRRLELELLRARSGRAIVERQLGEAQAMMEHYRSSWEQALEMSGHAVLEKLRDEVPCSWDPPQFPGVVPFAANLSGNWTPKSPSEESLEVPRGMAGSRCASPALPSFWPMTEAGTGGPPFFAEDERGGSGSAEADGDTSSAPSPGSQLRHLSMQSPPVPMALVEVRTKASEHSACASPSHSLLPSPRSPQLEKRSPVSNMSDDSARRPSSVSQILVQNSPLRDQAAPVVEQVEPPSLPSTPRVQTRQVVTMPNPSVLFCAGAAPVPAVGSCRMFRPSVLYNVPAPPARLVATPQQAPAVTLGAVPAVPLVPSVPPSTSAPHGHANPPTEDLMRVCEQSLAEAERSNDWRKQELAVTLRHLRSQLLDLNAKPSVANPNASARHLSLSPGAQHRVVRTAVEKTPRSRGSVTARTLSPAPATTPSTPLVQMRVPVSATSPQTPRMQSPVQLASGVSQPCRTSTFLSDVQVRTDWHSRPVSTMRCEAVPSVIAPAWAAGATPCMTAPSTRTRECLASVGLQTSQAPELPSWLGQQNVAVQNADARKDGGVHGFKGNSPWLSPQTEV